MMQEGCKRVPYLFACGLIVISVWIHAFVSGWGGVQDAPSGVKVSPEMAFGVVCNPSDNLTYCSWAQQAKAGIWLFSDLYTTTPHRSLYINPFFSLVGQLARLMQTTPMLILNLAALLSIMVFVLSIWSICRMMGFGGVTSMIVLCFSVGGGGVSWTRWLLVRTGLSDMLNIHAFGPDLFYTELYPATAFTLYPFHAVSLSLIALISALIIKYDDWRRGFSFKHGMALVMAAGALTAIRPYEPVLMVLSYLVLTFASFVLAVQQDVRHRRLLILFCLLTGISPVLVYNLWASGQPVWSSVAEHCLGLSNDRSFAAGFLILWVFAVHGMLSRNADGPSSWSNARIFFVIWTIWCGVLLVVIGSGYWKLCGGITIPLSIAAGVGVEKTIASITRRKMVIQLGLVVAFCSVASPLLVLYHVAHEPQRIDSEIFGLQCAIRADSVAVTPTVLTDPETGSVLPGIAGFRIFSGHPSLTDSFDARNKVLMALGFDSMPLRVGETLSRGEGLASQARLLEKQISQGVFDYLIVKRDQRICEELRVVAAAPSIVYDGTRFRVFRLSPEIQAELMRKLQSLE